jgi:PAS domain S-box-containing protein
VTGSRRARILTFEGNETKHSEEELRASHERLRFVLSSITDAYFALSRGWEILDVNPVAERLIFQHPKEALLGQNIWEICPHGKDSDYYGHYQEAFAEGRPVHFESKACIGEGWFEIHAYPSTDRLDVYGRDITERKQVEERLRMTQFSLDRAAEAVYWVNSNAGLAYVNDAACAALGYTREELLALTVHDIDPIVQPGIWPQHWEALRQSGKLCFETLHKRKSGETFPVQITSNFIQYAGCEYSCAFAHDLTERKQAERNLRQQNERLKLLNKTVANILSTDQPDSLVLHLYEQVADFLQTDALIEYEYEDPVLRLKTCVGLDESTRQAISRLQLGEALCGTVALEKRPMLVNNLELSPNPKAQLLKDLGFRAYICHPLIQGSKFVGTLAFVSRRRAVFDDVDREFFQTISGYVALGKERASLLAQLRRHAEDLEKTVHERTAKLEDMVRELEHFSYAITHDMRAPLRAMSGFARLMTQQYGTALDERAKDYLQRIHTSAQRMDNLITDALQYSQAVRSQPRLAPADPVPLLRGMVQCYPHLSPPNASVDIVEPIPRVLANTAGLTQVFSNLLSNAVKFVKPGLVPYIRIWAEARYEDDHQKPGAQRRLIRIWFEDNGIGIPQQYQGRIFDMFQRLSEDYEGTGIGLALVRKITERMGGQVGVESEEGGGSQFWIELVPAESGGSSESGSGPESWSI